MLAYQQCLMENLDLLKSRKCAKCRGWCFFLRLHGNHQVQQAYFGSYTDGAWCQLSATRMLAVIRIVDEKWADEYTCSQLVLSQCAGLQFYLWEM